MPLPYFCVIAALVRFPAISHSFADPFVASSLDSFRIEVFKTLLSIILNHPRLDQACSSAVQQLFSDGRIAPGEVQVITEHLIDPLAGSRGACLVALSVRTVLHDSEGHC